MKTRNRVILIAVTVVLVLLVPLGRSLMFTVNEREVAVVLQFGDPVATRVEPGFYWKLPFVQEVRRLPKTLQFWRATGREILVDLPTKDGKKIEVTPWAVWRITDPKQFVQVLRQVDNAELRVETFVRGAVRDVITSHDLVDVVRSTDRELTYSFQVEPGEMPIEPGEEGAGPPTEALPAAPGPQAAPMPSPDAAKQVTVGREKIVSEIKRQVRRELAESGESGQGARGIEVVDVGISRIDFVPMVREAAFKRLIAFMEAIASRYLNQGELRKQQILNETNAEVEKILGEGRQQSNQIKGETDAEIINSYAEAIKETGDFYTFVRTLEAYRAALGEKTRLILTTDSELMKLLRENPPVQGPATESSSGQE